MKISPSINSELKAEQAYTRSDSIQGDRLGRRRPEDYSHNRLEDPEVKHEPTRKILSSKEESMLHMLFGAQKPSEMTFYGRNKVSHIHKGQFLDIKG